MAQRHIQIILKRLTDDDLRSHGIKAQYNVNKTVHESRKRKLNEIESNDCIGRNTRSKTRLKPTETNVDTSSIPITTPTPIQLQHKKDAVSKQKPNDDSQKRKKNVNKSNSNVAAVDEASKNPEKMQSNKKVEHTVKTRSTKASSDFIGRNTRSRTQSKPSEINVSTSSISKPTPIQGQHKKDEMKTDEDTSGRKRKRGTQTRKSMKLQLKEQIDNDSPCRKYLVYEIVLATIPGFVPWPARVLKIMDQTIMVEFFGTGQKYALHFCIVYQGKVLQIFANSNICIFLKCLLLRLYIIYYTFFSFFNYRNLVRANSISTFSSCKITKYLERKGYKKAIIELEHVLGIPLDMTLFP